MPTSGYSTVKTNPCSESGGTPGVYSAYEVGPNETCTLNPGLYVITGPWTMKNNSLFKGTGVTLYFTCATTTEMPRPCTAPGETGGGLDTKNGNAQLVAPADSPLPVSGAVAGYVVIYDRNDTSGLNIQGNGTASFTGAIYAVKALLEFPGTTCVSIVNGPVIVDELYGNGTTGCVNLTNVNGASIPSPPDGVNLDQ
jgi:hypothetical protein